MSEDEYVTTEIQLQDLKISLTEENSKAEHVGANFFDPNYTCAAYTGSSVWEGSWVMMDYLKNHPSLVTGKKVVELGSGTGLLGLAIAALGGHVLCTDLSVVTKGVLHTNIIQNSVNAPDPIENSWSCSRRVGSGSITSLALDWTRNLSEQVGANDPLDNEVVMAVETVWLKELILPFVTTFVELLRGDTLKLGYLGFLDRSNQASTVFASSKELLQEFQNQGCSVKLLTTCVAPRTSNKTVNIFQIIIE
eukprot:TRINITY_DN5367_c0_g1_i1.p1 TRINITY_DN5367_c0_g1~~TRINITY_DN5367_c0_g1_i1.p1  ORF type:complete len:250 (-),score=44.10 TRINITY_DN5367_c0_g1_i1:73-822(-)